MGHPIQRSLLRYKHSKLTLRQIKDAFLFGAKRALCGSLFGPLPTSPPTERFVWPSWTWANFTSSYFRATVRDSLGLTQSLADALRSIQPIGGNGRKIKQSDK